MYTSLLLTIACFSSGVVSISLPSACSSDDSACLTSLLNTMKPIIFSAIPELGIESSDPMYMEEIIGDISTLKIKLTKTTFRGYLGCDILNVELNSDITKMKFDMDCPKFSVSGKYEAGGDLLGLPVEGNGDFKLTTGRYLIHLEGDVGKKQDDDGKTHVFVSAFTLNTDPVEPITFEFENLFNGDQGLSDAFHKFLTENWKQVANLGQGPIWEACIQKIVNNVNAFLNNFSLDNFLSDQ